VDQTLVREARSSSVNSNRSIRLLPIMLVRAAAH
jgi:hypothetical protein